MSAELDPPGVVARAPGGSARGLHAVVSDGGRSNHVHQQATPAKSVRWNHARGRRLDCFRGAAITSVLIPNHSCRSKAASRNETSSSAATRSIWFPRSPHRPEKRFQAFRDSATENDRPPSQLVDGTRTGELVPRPLEPGEQAVSLQIGLERHGGLGRFEVDPLCFGPRRYPPLLQPFVNVMSTCTREPRPSRESGLATPPDDERMRHGLRRPVMFGAGRAASRRPPLAGSSRVCGRRPVEDVGGIVAALAEAVLEDEGLRPVRASCEELAPVLILVHTELPFLPPLWISAGTLSCWRNPSGSPTLPFLDFRTDSRDNPSTSVEMEGRGNGTWTFR